MKIKTNKNEILDSLQKAQYFISSGSTLALLSNILFEAEGKKLNIIATDMDITAKIKCKVEEVEESGRTTIHKKIVSLVKELPDAGILIESDKNDNIKLKCAKSSYKIPGMPAEDFPVLQPEGKILETVKIPQATIKEIIAKIAYAALKDNTKRNLNGVFFRFEGTVIEAVATDAHRLAYIKMENKQAVKTKLEYIIPLKTINELQKIMDDDDKKTIEINFYEKLIEFKLENIDIISRIIDENYPNYRQVIPAETTITAKVKKEDLAASIRRVATITSEKSKVVMFKFEKNKLFINAQTQDEGEAYEEIDIKFDGEPTDVSYNAVYISEVLKAINGDEIEVKLVSSMNPGIIKDAAEPNFLYVVMPIRK